MKTEQPQNPVDLKDKESGEKLAKELANGVNHMADEWFERAFVDQLTLRTHRTLQQNVAKLFLATFKKWAEIGDQGPGYYDARNESTIKLAQTIREATMDSYLPFI
jgi:hypothetical protein